MIKKCRRCTNDQMNEQEQIFKNGTKHIALFCTKCGAFNNYKPQNKPITEEFAMHFKLTYGQYKGYELQNVDDKALENLMTFSKSEYMVKIYQAEQERRRRTWKELT